MGEEAAEGGKKEERRGRGMDERRKDGWWGEERGERKGRHGREKVLFGDVVER